MTSHTCQVKDPKTSMLVYNNIYRIYERPALDFSILEKPLSPLSLACSLSAFHDDDLLAIAHALLFCIGVAAALDARAENRDVVLLFLFLRRNSSPPRGNERIYCTCRVKISFSVRVCFCINTYVMCV